ncbi:hypothetical protein SBADM41S_04569 [Streptomyces badius]
MRCVIARFPFDLTKSGVLESMKGIKPEPVSGESVIIGRRTYPVKQVGQVITRQDRRDFSAGGGPPGDEQARLHLPGFAETAVTAMSGRALVTPRRVPSPSSRPPHCSAAPRPPDGRRGAGSAAAPGLVPAGEGSGLWGGAVGTGRVSGPRVAKSPMVQALTSSMATRYIPPVSGIPTEPWRIRATWKCRCVGGPSLRAVEVKTAANSLSRSESARTWETPPACRRSRGPGGR